MGTLARARFRGSRGRRRARKWTLVVLFGLALGLPAIARASEVEAAGGAVGFVIHGPDETLRDFCSTDPLGRLWLELPGGARYELVTSVLDPAVSNPGDGSFHAFDEAEVRRALAQVRYPLGGIGGDVFLLPFPRRAGFDSAAGLGLILLSPGTRPLAIEHQHAVFVHELGHVVQRALMPDSDPDAWDAYRRLRGIEDLTTYSDAGAHADRPHEIFAEDFRALFGGPLATSSGTIENASLARPGEVRGLRELMLGLAGVTAPLLLAAGPNPSFGPIRFWRSGGEAAPLDVFDAQGRRVASLPAEPRADLVQWTWDGRDASGRAVARGVFFARARGGTGGVTRAAVLRR